MSYVVVVFPQSHFHCENVPGHVICIMVDAARLLRINTNQQHWKTRRYVDTLNSTHMIGVESISKSPGVVNFFDNSKPLV